MIVIAKNQTAGALALDQLPVPGNEIPASGQVTLTDYVSIAEIQQDPQLLAHIVATDAIVNVDGVDLSAADSEAFVSTVPNTTFTDTEDGLTPASGGGSTNFLRADGSWQDPGGGGGTDRIACCPFGAKSDSLGKFLIANGKSTDADDSTKAKTRQPIAFDGTLTRLAYTTKDGSTATTMKVHVNGSVEATVILSSMNASGGGVETISVSVKAGDYAEIEYDAGQKPGECTMYFIEEPA
jgi:hypothetical protein